VQYEVWILDLQGKLYLGTSVQMSVATRQVIFATRQDLVA